MTARQRPNARLRDLLRRTGLLIVLGILPASAAELPPATDATAPREGSTAPARSATELPAEPVVVTAPATEPPPQLEPAPLPPPAEAARSAPRSAPALAATLALLPPQSQNRTVPAIRPALTLVPAAATPSSSAAPPAPGAASPDGVAVGQLAGARPAQATTVAASGPQGATTAPSGLDSVAPFKLLGETVHPGTFAQLTWNGTESFTSASIPSAVLVAHGSSPGPVICLAAAVHGDELNGIETVRRIMHDLDPARLSGTVIGVPIVNIQGFHRGSRYLPDRRDLNRYFPGNPNGSSASRIAHSFFYHVIVHCNALVDLHTGSFQRTNLPQVRADLNDPGAMSLTQGFGSIVIMHNDGESGTLRAAATRAGIPAVTLEAGAPMQVQEEAVSQSEQGIRTLLDTLGVYRQPGLRIAPSPAYYQSRWVRTDHGGILSTKVSLGRLVEPGELLGTVVDPLTNQQQEIRSPLRGRVLGMALDQFVMPGYATFHIGIEAPVEEVIETAPAQEPEHEAAEVEQGFDES